MSPPEFDDDRRQNVDHYWPIWRFDQGGFGSLARFVSPRALNGHGLNATRTDLEDPEDDLEMIDLLLGRFAERGFEFDEAKWTAREQGNQPVRHPGWIASEGGNCLDLSSAFGAMCLSVGIAPLLALTGNHVFLIVRPGWLQQHGRTEEALDVDGVEPGDDPGQLTVVDPTELRRMLEARQLIAIDCVTVVDEASPDHASAPCAEWIDEGLMLIDVAFEQDFGGYPPLDPPLGWPSIRRFPPSAVDPPELNAAQKNLADLLGGLPRERGVTTAIRAEAGSGKSTVARYLVKNVRNRAAWFLNASDSQSLIDSLAEAEMAERGMNADGESDGLETSSLERPDRMGFALAAVDRLRRATTPWLIVLDNANGDPARLQDLIPEPRRRQMVLFTTTGEDPNWSDSKWRPDVIRHELRGAAPDEVAGQVDESLVELIGGRPLMVEAFRRLLSDDRVDADGILESGTLVEADSGVDLAAGAYWMSLRALLGDGQLQLSAVAARLPVDRLPATLIKRLAGANDSDLEVLTQLGLFGAGSDPDGQQLTVHRLIARAVRALGTGRKAPPGTTPPAAIIAADEVACDLLGLYGDQEVVALLVEELEQMTAVRSDVFDLQIRGLANLASVFELRGRVRDSADTFASVESKIGDDEQHADLRALCLFSRARVVNRDGGATREAIENGLEEARQAYGIVISNDPGAAGQLKSGRFLAMVGLLQKRLAPLADDDEAIVTGLHESLADLERAQELRSVLPDTHPEQLRSTFNLAGIHVALAVAEPERASAHLDRAEEIYSGVAEKRRSLYKSEVHSHIAICVQGQGIVAYFRAMRVARDSGERSSYLREAHYRYGQALAQWEAIESGEDGNETSKANKLVAKAALARAAHRKLETRATGSEESSGISDFFIEIAEEATGDLSPRFTIDEP